jgi:hypothetical protein
MPETLPEAELVHSLPGRTRLRFAERRRDSVFLAAIATALSASQGVIRVEARSSTGSLLVWHSGPIERIGSAAKAQSLFTIAPVKPVQAAPHAELSKKSMVTAAMFVLAIWQLARGHILPPALTLAMYAIDLAGLLVEDGSSGNAANEADE